MSAQKCKARIICFLITVLLLTVNVGCGQNEQQEQNNQTQLEQEDNSFALPGVGPNMIADIVEQVSPAVLKIETVSLEQVENPFINDPFFRHFFGDSLMPYTQERPGLGSGFIISKDGYILTNQHVIEGANEIYVRIKGNEEAVPAKVVGADYDLDLAVLKIDEDKDLPYLKLGSSEDIKVGNWVIAIGSPFGLEDTVTVGVISAKERPVSIDDRHYEHLLQTDASINPGNSGGPLLNLKGEVVGINTAINAQAQGIGFAIPTSTVKDVIDQLIEHGKVIRPWLGVQIRTLDGEIAQYYHLEQQWGVIVVDVVNGSPADKAGIHAGDIIIGLDGKKITTAEELTSTVQAREIGDRVTVDLIRKGEKLTFNITVEERSK